MTMETAEIIPADVSAKMDAAMGASKSVTSEGMDSEIDKALDAAIDNVPEKYRESAGLGKRAEKKEQPKDAKAEKSADAPEADEGEAQAESEKEEKSDAEPDYALEKALAALRLDGVPPETITAMLANQAGRDQLLKWGSKVSEKHAATAQKLKDQAEELKRAKEPKEEATTKAEASSPTADADFSKDLEAFKEYGEEFQKGQSGLARAIYQKARESVMSEIQPAVGVLLEMRSVMEEMVNESLDRELGERFPRLVEGEARKEAEAAFKRLWGKDGASYKDAAPTLLGRIRAARADAYQLVDSKQPAPRKDDSQTKANRIPAAPARSVPRKSLSVDEQVDAIVEQSMKKYAER